MNLVLGRFYEVPGFWVLLVVGNRLVGVLLLALGWSFVVGGRFSELGREIV